MSRSGKIAVLACCALWIAADAAAQQSRSGPVNVDVVVAYISDRPPAAERPPPPSPRPSQMLAPQFDAGRSGPAAAERRAKQIDERVRRLDRTLKRQFRYDEMQLVERHRMVLDMEEEGTVTLPNGHRFRARPLEMDGRGGLRMNVGVEDRVQTEIRARSGRLVVIGAEPYREGKLVISIEPRY